MLVSTWVEPASGSSWVLGLVLSGSFRFRCKCLWGEIPVSLGRDTLGRDTGERDLCEFLPLENLLGSLAPHGVV